MGFEFGYVDVNMKVYYVSVVCLVCSRYFDEIEKLELQFNNYMIICVGCRNLIECYFLEFIIWSFEFVSL